MTSPAQPSMTTTAHWRHAALAGCAVLAAAGLLARRADGASVVPEWAETTLQVPAVLAWIGLRCGGFSLRRRSSVSGANALLTVVVAICAAGLAIASDHVVVISTALTVFICGALLVDRLTALYRRVDERMLEPAGLLRMLGGHWLGLILLVTILLSLPLATNSAVPDYSHDFWDHVLNNAFAAASSASLVGNTIYGLGGEYSLFGQVVILLAMQLAGMGFAAIGLATVQPFLNGVVRLRTVLVVSIGLQVLASGVTWTSWLATDAAGVWDRFWWGLVHAAGALWNGGILLRNDGFSQYVADRSVFACVTSLAVIGSLSLPIIIDLLGVRRRSGGGDATAAGPPRRPQKSAKQPARTAGKRASPRPPWRSLPQCEAALAFALLLGGAVALWFCETPWRENIVWRLSDSWIPDRPVDLGTNQIVLRDDLSYGQRWTRTVFMSAALRSAGLQSTPVSEGALSWPSYGLSLAWMMIGGSAGGVAGGMSTTGIVLLAVCILGRRRWMAQPGGRASHSRILRACLLFPLLWVAINAAHLGLLAATSDGTAYEIVLESVAACNNVGLSTGLSLHLTVAGRLVMILAMVTGRMIPVWYWLAVSRRFSASLRESGGRHS